MSTSSSRRIRRLGGSSKWFRGVSLLVGGLLALSVWAAPGLSAQTSASADESSSGTAVNQARAAAGRSTLDRNGGLDSVARLHADRMAEGDVIFHNQNLKPEADAAGVDWEIIGENVGVGPSVEHVHDGFMNSDGHRTNLLYPTYNSMGVGVAYGSDGSAFVVHVFARVAAAPAPVTTQPVAESPDPSEPTSTSAEPNPTAAVPTPSVLAQPVVTPGANAAPEAEVPEELENTDLNLLTGGVVNRQIVVSGS